MATSAPVAPEQASPFEPGQGVPNDNDSRMGDIVQRFKESQKFMQDNYWDEFAEVYRAVKCRTKPIMVKDPKTNKLVEDKNRTNVCMPELSLIVRRKTARLTANPPNLNYRVPGDDQTMLAERLNARAYYEYDRSGESVHFKRSIQQANTFGYTYDKTFYDTVTVQRQMRYAVDSLTSRRSLLKAQGASEDQIQSTPEDEQVPPDELASLISGSGPELRNTLPSVQYEGPISRCVFIGDLYLEPGCLTLNDSDFVIELYNQTILWLKNMAQKTYKDPESGRDVRIFDPKKVEELLEKDSKLPQDRLFDLQRQLRDAIQQNNPRLDKRLLPGKRFEIMEYHSADKNGNNWIEYVGNDSVYLGRQPYPFDLGGKWVYTEFVPWPDLIGAIGDSSPRLLRFLHAMHNAAVGQRNDLITQVLRRTYWMEHANEVPTEVIDRNFGRVLIGKSFPKALDESDVPSSAWQTEAQILSRMQAAEPAMGGVEAEGTDFNPQSGKTATTALLQAKSSDALTQAEIDNLNTFIKEKGEKKLEIHRQLSDTINVPNRAAYVKSDQLTEMAKGKSTISIESVPELQGQDGEFIEVEPEAGSTLAVDDEFKRNSVLQGYQMAIGNPQVFNVRYWAEQVCKTIKGIDKTQALVPDAPPAPVPPKIGINISIPLDKMPPDIQQQVFAEAGMKPSADLEQKGQMDAVIHASNAADAAANLTSPAHPPQVKPNGLDGVIAQKQGELQNKVNAIP
jgi:hypothetical protein